MVMVADSLLPSLLRWKHFAQEISEHGCIAFEIVI